jgi:sugar (pentulose or hexulose) kinase
MHGTDSLLIGLDIGTSAVDACAFHPDGRLSARCSIALTTTYPLAGWAEQSPGAWSAAALQALRGLVRRLGTKRAALAAVGLTGQCPSGALVDAAGVPLSSGLIYQDTRATAEAASIERRFGAAEIRRRTGMWPSPYYLAGKAMWLGRHHTELRAQHPWLLQPRDVMALTLTGNMATDETHAGCTGLYDLGVRAWAHDWLEALDLGWLRLPPVYAPSEKVGGVAPAAAEVSGLPAGLPVAIGAADNFCGDLGIDALAPGVLGDTSGTTTCLDLAVQRADVTWHQLAPNLGVYAHFLPHLFYLDAGLNATGATARWAARMLTQGDLRRLEHLASSSEADDHAPLLLPYLGGGDRSDGAAMGSWHGLSLAHGPERLALSVYEGLTFGLRELVDQLREAGASPERAYLAGGGSRSRLWNTLKANIWNLPVHVSEHGDASALGAALLAGVACGLYRDLEHAVQSAVRPGHAIEPTPRVAEIYDALYRRWLACKRSNPGVAQAL